MPVKTKRKAVKKEAPLTPKYERLRLREWMMFWILVAATIALVCAIFGNVDVRTLRPMGVTSSTSLSSVNSDQDISRLNNQINSLHRDLANAESQLEASRTPCLSEAPAAIDNYPTYTDEEKSFKFQVPFSTAWANPDCDFAPADIQSGHYISFGPYVAGELTEAGRPTVVRDSTIVAVNDEKSVAEIRGMLKDPQEGSIQNLRERTVSGMTVFSYTLDYVGPSLNQWVAIGRNYRYNITSQGWLPDAEAIKIIQSLRVTK